MVVSNILFIFVDPGGWEKMTPSGLEHTVDGRNPAPVDTVNIPLFAGFHAFQLAQDFFPSRVFFRWVATKARIGRIHGTSILTY